MKKFIGSIFLVTILLSFQSVPKKQVSTKPPVSINESIERGKAVYVKNCLSCHQMDGGGVPHLNAPLDGASAVVGNDKAKIINIVLKGMADRVEIDGEFYSNSMASHKELSNQQIADVLTYIRNSWNNKASAVTPEEVKIVRAKIK
jgi:mono/diheme cytochrome c family protein